MGLCRVAPDLFSGVDGALWKDNKSYDWSGRCGCFASDTIGLLVDLQRKSITCFRNGELAGVMTEGNDSQGEGHQLTGPLCWLVELSRPDDEVHVRITAAPASGIA